MSGAATRHEGSHAAAAPAGDALQRTRRGQYFVLNLGFVILVASAAALGVSDNPRVLYLCLLFAICSGALLCGRANGPYGILSVLLAFYFLCYGAADVLALFTPTAPQATLAGALLSGGEIAILLGAALLVCGYRGGVALTPSVPATAAGRDWPNHVAIGVGLVLWLLGIAATWIWASEVVERYVTSTQLGPFQAMGITLARYAQPVGFALIAYRFVASRGVFLTLLVLVMLAGEFAFGFIADSKELSIRGAAILLVASFFVHGRAPKTWLVVAACVIVVSFPVFQAYRLEVLQEGGQTRAQGARNLGDNLEAALRSDLVTNGGLGQAKGALGRLSLKPTMELIVARVGIDLPYRDGETIALLLTSLVPRILWPEKPDAAVGQLFNRQFGISADPNTFISATQLGELYWNFGWTGILVGMPLIGVLLGWVGGRFCLAEHRSITRFLILVVTVYLIVLRFEGGIAMTYTQWLRSAALVLLLHAVFARPRAAASAVATTTRPQPNTSAADGLQGKQISLPNLMR